MFILMFVLLFSFKFKFAEDLKKTAWSQNTTSVMIQKHLR